MKVSGPHSKRRSRPRLRLSSDGIAQSEALPFSDEVEKACAKRRRAIAYRGADIECLPVKEIVDGRESPDGRTDLEISFRVRGAPVRLRLHAWDTGGCGWTFE
jgi:hypothetical protein